MDNNYKSNMRQLSKTEQRWQRWVVGVFVALAAKVTCTAKSNAGKPADTTADYTINTRFYGNGLPCNNGSGGGSYSVSGTSLVVLPGMTQFGPYRTISQGCYLVKYRGLGYVNDTSKTGVASYYNLDATDIPVRSLSISSAISYYINVPSGVSNIEFFLRNYSTAAMWVDWIDVTKVASCPAN